MRRCGVWLSAPLAGALGRPDARAYRQDWRPCSEAEGSSARRAEVASPQRRSASARGGRLRYARM